MEPDFKKRRRNIILGIIAGILFMIGDLLWEFHCPGVTKNIDGMFIDTSWTEFGQWRFPASVIAAAVAMPLYYLGFMEMPEIIIEHARNDFDRKLAKWFKAAVVFAMIFFLFIHAALVISGTLYNEVFAVTGDAAASAQVCNNMLVAQAVPLIAGYILSDGIYVVVMIILAFRKVLPVNPILVFFSNPLITAVVGNILNLCPWPFKEIEPASESFGHVMMMVVALVVIYKDRKKVLKDEKDQ